jgi:NAD(P)-dependent dehydrogenase (short-subunit alcohol dehydrogenase family)
MKVLVIGASGVIGSAVAAALAPHHEVVRASFSKSDVTVDLANPESVRALYATVGRVDAVLSCAGQAAFGPLVDLTDTDFGDSVANKLMGQVNLVRYGIESVSDGGCFVLCSGVVSRRPVAGGAALSLVNAGLDGFVRAAALELPRRMRINAVSPGWVSETLVSMGRDPRVGVPAVVVAQTYLQAVTGTTTGRIFGVPAL